MGLSLRDLRDARAAKKNDLSRDERGRFLLFGELDDFHTDRNNTSAQHVEFARGGF